MTIFICLDDADGLAFNHRRQSRDRVLCEHIAALSQKGVLRMNTSSFPLCSYPADLHFSVPEGWKKVREIEFEGSSHPTITQEDYVKCEN